jgi:hypothetical protein
MVGGLQQLVLLGLHRVPLHHHDVIDHFNYHYYNNDCAVHRTRVRISWTGDRLRELVLPGMLAVHNHNHNNHFHNQHYDINHTYHNQ